MAEFKTIKYPSQGTVFDYYIDTETKEFLPWSHIIPKYELDSDMPLQVTTCTLDETVRPFHVWTFRAHWCTRRNRLEPGFSLTCSWTANIRSCWSAVPVAAKPYWWTKSSPHFRIITQWPTYRSISIRHLVNCLTFESVEFENIFLRPCLISDLVFRRNVTENIGETAGEKSRKKLWTAWK